MKIICINGSPMSGKDTFVEFCGSQTSGVFNTSMIDCIKRIASLFGWNGDKGKKDRKFLSDLKDLITEYNDFPFIDVLEQLMIAEKNHKYYEWYDGLDKELICFIHAREPKDIERWRDEYGAKALLIRREETEGDYGNHADDQVFDVDYDYVIFNDSDLDDLEKKAKNFIEQVRKEEWYSEIWK